MDKKILTILFVLALLPLKVFAQEAAIQLRGNTMTIVNPLPTEGAMNLGHSNGLSFPIAGTQPIYPAAAVLTPSTSFPTPNSADSMVNRYNIVATAAPTAIFVELPKATPRVGKTFTTVNQSANPLLIVPITGDSVNAVAAGTPYSCATTKVCDCTALANTLYSCTSR